MDALLIEHKDAISALDEEARKITYETMFIFSCMWAFGGSIGGG